MIIKQPVSKPVRAVVTADIVNSTGLMPDMEKMLIDGLKGILKPYTFEFFRGDSFQVYLEEPVKALQVALQCRTLAISLEEVNDVPSDVRISIGLGPVVEPVKELGSAKGEAFLLSGRSFDALQKSGIRLTIVTENNLANIGLQVIADYLHSIYEGMTAKQAAVIIELLNGEAQQKVAAELNKSKSTISQLVSAGRWPEIERLLQQYDDIINLLV